MSQESVEIVRLMNAAFNCGDLYEAFGFYHPAAIWRSRRDEPDIANRPLKTKEPRCHGGSRMRQGDSNSGWQSVTTGGAPLATFGLVTAAGRSREAGPWRPVPPRYRTFVCSCVCTGGGANSREPRLSTSAAPTCRVGRRAGDGPSPGPRRSCRTSAGPVGSCPRDARAAQHHLVAARRHLDGDRIRDRSQGGPDRRPAGHVKRSPTRADCRASRSSNGWRVRRSAGGTGL